MPFDRSSVMPFRIAEDPGYLYVMIDAKVLTDALAGLSTAEKNAIKAYQFTPTPAQLPYIPQWAGQDPPPIYARATDAQIKFAMRKRYSTPQTGETDSEDTVSTTPVPEAPING
jgi:hypothetical protein